MDDVISKLTAQQALKVVERLSRKGGELREAVLTEAMNVLTEVDVDEIADEVIAALESIDVQDCWDRSGNSRDGYTSPYEAADEIVNQELQLLRQGGAGEQTLRDDRGEPCVAVRHPRPWRRGVRGRGRNGR